MITKRLRKMKLSDVEICLQESLALIKCTSIVDAHLATSVYNTFMDPMDIMHDGRNRQYDIRLLVLFFFLYFFYLQLYNKSIKE